jgi:hypothetical protein
LGDEEVGNIGSRDFQLRLLIAGEVALISPGAWAVGECRWPNNRPIKIAPFDVFLLPHVIVVCGAQQQSEHHVLPQKVQVASAVADPERGLANQPTNAGALHCLDNCPGSVRANVSLPAGAERDDDRIMLRDGSLHRLGIGDVALSDL